MPFIIRISAKLGCISISQESAIEHQTFICRKEKKPLNPLTFICDELYYGVPMPSYWTVGWCAHFLAQSPVRLQMLITICALLPVSSKWELVILNAGIQWAWIPGRSCTVPLSCSGPQGHCANMPQLPSGPSDGLQLRKRAAHRHLFKDRWNG